MSTLRGRAGTAVLVEEAQLGDDGAGERQEDSEVEASLGEVAGSGGATVPRPNGP